MISFLLNMLGDPNEKKVKSIMGIIDHINALEPQFEKLTDEELRAKTDEFKEILANALHHQISRQTENLKKKLWIKSFPKRLRLCVKQVNVC